jgi:hypothetical protein
MNKLIISKGGNLLKNTWNKEKLEEELVPVYNYQTVLCDECKAEEVLKLKDILLMVESFNDYEFLSPLLTRGPWLKAIVDEGLKNEAKACEIKEIKLSWIFEIEDESEISSLLKEYIYTGGIGENKENISMMFSKTNELTDCKIILDYKTSFTDYNGKNIQSMSKIIKRFTLFDILKGIFFELSWHGDPKNRDKKIKKLLKDLNDENYI